mmetsp:Transcript_15703/g.37298  ORF Transcript_15703/g.37298 Transcript_15703/m.37298 type:complete len:522 (-) Transcript_15703:291-1856(-)
MIPESDSEAEKAEVSASLDRNPVEFVESGSEGSAAMSPRGLDNTLVQAPLQKLWELERIEMARQRDELRRARGDIRSFGHDELARYREAEQTAKQELKSSLQELVLNAENDDALTLESLLRAVEAGQGNTAASPFLQQFMSAQRARVQSTNRNSKASSQRPQDLRPLLVGLLVVSATSFALKRLRVGCRLRHLVRNLCSRALKAWRERLAGPSVPKTSSGRLASSRGNHGETPQKQAEQHLSQCNLRIRDRLTAGWQSPWSLVHPSDGKRPADAATAGAPQTADQAEPLSALAHQEARHRPIPLLPLPRGAAHSGHPAEGGAAWPLPRALHQQGWDHGAPGRRFSSRNLDAVVIPVSVPRAGIQQPLSGARLAASGRPPGSTPALAAPGSVQSAPGSPRAHRRSESAAAELSPRDAAERKELAHAAERFARCNFLTAPTLSFRAWERRNLDSLSPAEEKPSQDGGSAANPAGQVGVSFRSCVEDAAEPLHHTPQLPAGGEKGRANASGPERGDAGAEVTAA